MHPDEAYKIFSNRLTNQESITIKTGNGGLSYYKDSIFVCHFNAKPQAKRDDLGFADFRYDGLRPYLDVEATITAMQNEAFPEVEIKSQKLWCSLHFPLSMLENVADLFLKHIITKVNISSKQENNL